MFVLGATSKAAPPAHSKATQIIGEEYRSRVRQEKNAQRTEAWSLWHLLLHPQPTSPWDPESTFSSGAVAMARQGRGFLRMSASTNNTAATQALRKEMVAQRRIRHDNSYTHHLQEYIDARKKYYERLCLIRK